MEPSSKSYRARLKARLKRLSSGDRRMSAGALAGMLACEEAALKPLTTDRLASVVVMAEDIEGQGERGHP